MIESVAGKLAHWLKANVPDHPQPEENLQFGFHLVLNTIFTLVVSVIIGLAFDILKETIFVLFSFGMLRMISGGYHFKSAIICIVVSAGLGGLLPLIEISDTSLWVINIFNILLVLTFAPSGIEDQTRIPKRFYSMLKVASVLLVASNLFFGSKLLALTWLIQCVSLVRMRGGEER